MTEGHFNIPDKTTGDPASYPLVHTMFGMKITLKGESIFNK